MKVENFNELFSLKMAKTYSNVFKRLNMLIATLCERQTFKNIVYAIFYSNILNFE